MAARTLEQRVEILEAEIAGIKQANSPTDKSTLPWWEEIRGEFKNDVAYSEAMRYGQEYRASLRPSEGSDSDGQ